MVTWFTYRFINKNIWFDVIKNKANLEDSNSELASFCLSMIKVHENYLIIFKMFRYSLPWLVASRVYSHSKNTVSLSPVLIVPKRVKELFGKN